MRNPCLKMIDNMTHTYWNIIGRSCSDDLEANNAETDPKLRAERRKAHRKEFERKEEERKKKENELLEIKQRIEKETDRMKIENEIKDLEEDDEEDYEDDEEY